MPSFDAEPLRISGFAKYKVTFHFEITPSECVDAPDERQHVEREAIHLEVEAFLEDIIPTDYDSKMRVLFWHAKKALERGDSSLVIDREYARVNWVDANRITCLPTEPFTILRPVKMGFHT
jgi:hypothetical protein